MAISYDEVKELHSVLEVQQETRHSEVRALRRYWHGHYWGDERNSASAVSQLFMDLKGRQTDFGPDVKLVDNILQEVCVKLQSYLSPVPMIRTFIDGEHSELKARQANHRERILYGTWGANTISRKMSRIAWYLPLMGDCFHGIWPNFETGVPRMIVRSPENAYPVRAADGETLEQVIFRYELPERVVERTWKNYERQATGDRKRTRSMSWMGRKRQTGERMVEILEYSAGDEVALWAGEQKLQGVEHDFGFNLFEQMFFIEVPDEDFNHGAVEQVVSLVEMGNALHSMVFQSALEHAFPTLFIEDPAKLPEEMVKGPGSVIAANAGGKAGYITPPVQALPVQVGFLNDNRDKITRAGGLAGVHFGESPASSIVTGKAVNELQGAGTGTTVEMVQGVGIGPQLAAWNEKALFIYKRLHADDRINLHGLQPSSAFDVNPRQFSLSFKGKEVVGSSRNEIVFSPHLDQHTKVIMGLQMAAGGLVSRQYQREQVGIYDSEAMDEEILAEQVRDIYLEGLKQSVIAQGATEEAALAATAQGVRYGEKAPEGASALPSFLTQPTAGPPGPGNAPPGLAPGGLPALPAGPPPQPGAPGAPVQPEAPAGVVGLEQAIQAFQSLELVGQAFLVGEIVQQGQTDDEVEVRLTARDDLAAVRSVPFPVDARVVPEPPTEPNVEVTPGASPVTAGEEPAPEELLLA